MSPQFIYNLRSNIPDEGMYFQDLMDILTKHGVCQEKLYPYQTREPITKQVFEAAANFKIKSYAMIPFNADVSVVKTAISKNGPCVMSLPVYNLSQTFWIKQPNDNFIGGHAIAIVGYTEHSFIIRNSWGSRWAFEGYSYYTFEDYAAYHHMEIWTTVDDVSEILPPDPEDSRCGVCVLL